MIFSPPFVTATATAVAGSKFKEGIGRVERQVDGSTYVIATGREKVTVNITAGTLTAGEQVFITTRHEGLVIERLNPSTGAGAMAKSDSFLLFGAATRPALDRALESISATLTQGNGDASTLRQSAALFAVIAGECSSVNHQLTLDISAALGALARSDTSLGDAASVVVLIDRLRNQIAAATGLESRTIALNRALPDGIYSFLTATDALRFLGGEDSATDRLKAALEAFGVIIIRTSSIGNQTIATLLRPDDVLRELRAWNAASQSRLFQSLSADVLEQLFINRGSVPLERLRLLDAFAAAMQLPSANGRGGNAAAQSAALGQWLDAAVDVRATPSALAARAPVFSVSLMIDALDDCAAVKNLAPSVPPPVVSPGISAAALSDSSSRATVLGAAFSGLGLDFEHTLGKGDIPDANSLKRLLLQLLRAASETVPDTSPRVPGESAASRELTGTRNALEQAVMAFIDKSLSGRAPAAPDAANAAENPLQALVKQLYALLPALRERINGLLADAKQLSSSSTATSGGARPAVPPEVAEAFIRDARTRIESLLSANASTVEQLLRRALPSLSPAEILTSLSREIDEPGQRLLRAVEASLREALQSGPARNAQSTAGGAVSVSEQEQLTQDPMAADRALTRQTVERILNRVESLQLLARQTTTASGDQQILALPVKIGDEWTEMHVRFIRQRTGKGGGNHRRYTVYVNVAPALLGAIDARLDYQDKKSLSLSLDFESMATCQWFLDRKAQLRDALTALGVPSPRIEIVRPRPVSPDKEEAVAAPSSGTAIIDLKA
jgi:hypothetical protein